MAPVGEPALKKQKLDADLDIFSRLESERNDVSNKECL